MESYAFQTDLRCWDQPSDPALTGLPEEQEVEEGRSFYWPQFHFVGTQVVMANGERKARTTAAVVAYMHQRDTVDEHAHHALITMRVPMRRVVPQ